WIEDWTTFLSFEPQFSPTSLKRYKRGEIVKAHLGFNVGSEEGGLHYAVVLDKNNFLKSPVVTVVPLTSVKPHINVNTLHKGSIFLGNELFTSLYAKIVSLQTATDKEIKEVHEMVGKMKSIMTASDAEMDAVTNRLEQLDET
ncbi:MAG: type II toxin-antitoxin system PemK/MazF family toxin, partial [Lachnospiraceae bacterium]